MSASMNLKSLARSLGISKTTVSRALNGYPEVNARTRERVLAAAQAAGYEANPMARSLAVGRTNVFGLIYPTGASDLGDPMFLNVVGGISAALEPLRRHLIIAPVNGGNEVGAYEQMVRSRRVDGLVVSRTHVDDARIAYLAKVGFPFVAYGRTGLGQPHAWLDVDHAGGIKAAFAHLREHGHERIGYLGAPSQYHFAAARRSAYDAAVAEAGLHVYPGHATLGGMDARSGYQAMSHLLQASPRPTAVIVDNHLSGGGAVRALLDAGLVPGRDLSVVVWGGLEDSLLDLSVTAIAQPDPAQVGSKLVEMLSALVGDTPAAELQCELPVSLRPGASVGHSAG
jgi:LacI family transcriptional regulator